MIHIRFYNGASSSIGWNKGEASGTSYGSELFALL